MSEFSELKPGDEIGVLNFGNATIQKVGRVTASQIIIAETDQRFNKKTGRRIGDTSWRPACLIPAENARKHIEARRLERRRVTIDRIINEARGGFQIAQDKVPGALREIADELDAAKGKG